MYNIIKKCVKYEYHKIKNRKFKKLSYIYKLKIIC